MKIETAQLPTILTLIRLVFSPLVLPLLLVILLPYENIFLNSFGALLFAALSITDFLDGYLARRFSAESLLGALLDPLADKFLLYATLIALVALGKIYYYWAIIFIGREFLVMGLRSFALEYDCALPVMWFGKVKTFFQYLYLTIAILNVPGTFMFLDHLEQWTLIFALGLTIASGYKYTHLFYVQMKEQEHAG
jgi:CDP-diacylglycerol--glycerol-3-phosphate 3-phosphatidyltransferase